MPGFNDQFNAGNESQEPIEGEPIDPQEGNEPETESDAGENAAETSSHVRNIGSTVRPLDGRTGANGQPIAGVYVGKETRYDDEKGEVVETGRDLVAWLPTEAVDSDALEDAS